MVRDAKELRSAGYEEFGNPQKWMICAGMCSVLSSKVR